jgi:hypothetical protein
VPEILDAIVESEDQTLQSWGGAASWEKQVSVLCCAFDYVCSGDMCVLSNVVNVAHHAVFCLMM